MTYQGDFTALASKYRKIFFYKDFASCFSAKRFFFPHSSDKKLKTP